MDIKEYWAHVLAQDVEQIRRWFHPDACVNWHCSNERFTVEEYIRANCEYPGDWDGEVERIVMCGDTVITATHVYLKDKSMSFHVASFFQFKGDRIQCLDEYWGDDGPAPGWRQALQIGAPIHAT